MVGLNWLSGEGSDAYVISSTGGTTTIDNFAVDEKEDTLLLGINLNNILCKRDGTNLVITYCTTHVITILKWFMPGKSAKHKHLTIITKDKSTIDVFHDSKDEGSKSEYSCWLTGIQKDPFDDVKSINLARKEYQYVQTLISSSSSKERGNTLKGNSLPNILLGRGHAVFLMGRSGSDQYIIPVKTKAWIHNYDRDETPSEDRIMLDASFDELSLVKKGNHLSLEAKEKGISVTLMNWFNKGKEKNSQHATFVTNNNLIFGVKEKRRKLVKVPFILDYSNRPVAMDLNLKNHKVPILSQGIVMTEMRSIISSRFGDHLVGNGLDNTFVCKGKGIQIVGGGGEDTFHITESCHGRLDLRSKDSKKSKIQLHCEYSQFWVCTDSTKTSLNIICIPKEVKNPNPSKLHKLCKNSLKILHWNTLEHKSKVEIFSSDGFKMIGESLRISKRKRKLTRVDSIEINKREHSLCCFLNLNLGTEYLSTNKFNSSYLEFLSAIKMNVNNTDSVIKGNKQANLIQGGYKLKGYNSLLEGDDGADYYRINAGDGKVVINNHASDGLQDVVELGIPFDHIGVALEEETGTVLLFDEEEPDRTQVHLLNYWKDSASRHADFKSSDHVKFMLLSVFPFKEAQVIDFSFSRFPEMIQPRLTGAGIYGNVKEIYGSHFASNVIFGTESTLRIIGGMRNDSIDGGSGDEIIEGYDGDDLILGRGGDDILRGGDGNDTILGGEGSDIIRGGHGSDIIDGGLGMDFVIYGGGIGNQPDDTDRDLEPSGVDISLRDKTGRKGDAEADSLQNIEGIMGTAFDDTLEDDDGNNEIDAGAGDDKIISHGGRDRLVGDIGHDVYDLRNASGRKIIDNFDNHSNPIQFDDVILQLSAFPSWSDTNRLPVSLSQLLICSFKHRDHLYVVFKNGLRLILENWNLNEQHRHLEFHVIGHERNVKIYSQDEFHLALNIPSNLKPQLSLVHQNQTSVVLKQICHNCPERMVHYTSSSDPRLKIATFKHRNNDLLTIDNLSAGSRYSFGPAAVYCDEVLETGKPLIVKIQPNPPTDIKVTVIAGKFVQISWTPPYKTDYYAIEYAYTGEVHFMKSRATAGKSLKNKTTISTFGREVSFSLPDNLLGGEKLRVGVTIASLHEGKTSSIVSKTVDRKIQHFSCKNATSLKKDLDEKILDYCAKLKVELTKSEVLGSNNGKTPSCAPESKASPNVSRSCFMKCFSPKAENQYVDPIDRRTNRTFQIYSIFDAEARLSIRCLPNYSFVETEERERKVKCSEGEWIPHIPKCLPMCPPPPLILNGNLSVREDLATYSCNKGTFLYGKKELDCTRNIWGPVEESVCVEA